MNTRLKQLRIFSSEMYKSSQKEVVLFRLTDTACFVRMTAFTMIHAATGGSGIDHREPYVDEPTAWAETYVFLPGGKDYEKSGHCNGKHQ